MKNTPYFPDAEVPLPKRMTPEQFVNWVASWVLEGDVIDPAKDSGRFNVDPHEEPYEYDMGTDEVYDNYRTIITEARRLAGKETA